MSVVEQGATRITTTVDGTGTIRIISEPLPPVMTVSTLILGLNAAKKLRADLSRLIKMAEAGLTPTPKP